MTKLHRVLWALIFLGILTGIGKLGWDHYEEGVAVQKQIDALVTISQDNIGDVFKDGLPTFILACTPDICNEMKPLLADLQKQYNGRAHVVMLDAIASQALLVKILTITMNVLETKFPTAFPTAIMLDAETKPVGFKIGLGSEDEFKALIDKAFAPAALPTGQ